MEFENWIVSNDGISWKDQGLKRFRIPADDLNRTGNSGRGTRVYEWIMMATNQDWLTQNDLYDLNFAFVFAISKYGLEFDYSIFDATLAEQYELFEEEDAEDPTL